MNSTPKDSYSPRRGGVARSLMLWTTLGLCAVSLYLCHRAVRVMERAVTVMDRVDTKLDRAVAASATAIDRGREVISSAEADRLREVAERGAELIRLLQDNADADSVLQFIGKSAAFEGGTAPKGGNADLMVSKDVRLQVLIVPYKDVRPQAVSWGASVIGVIRAVGVDSKVITIEVKPDDYVVGDTM